MSRIDWVIVRRLAARIGITLTVFFGLLCLVESLDTRRFQGLSAFGGPLLAIGGIATGAARTLVGISPVIVLIGTILAVLDLQARRELTIIKASGTSIWRILLAPVLLAVALGSAVSFVGDSAAITFSRGLPVGGAGSKSDEIWLEQRGTDGFYILQAQRVLDRGTTLEDVALFFTDPQNRIRIEAPSARLTEGAWELADSTLYRVDSPPETLPKRRISTATTPADMVVRLTRVTDLTFGELVNIVSQNVADPRLRGAAITSLLRLFALPGLLVGSVLIGFAFTSGYQRTNKYGGAVLYGVVLGFVVYVVTELAYRSGYAGVLDPAFAAAGPAFVAIVIGLTVLLYKEDGRT